MSQKFKVPCKVLDKRKKDGWFGQSFYVTFRVFTHDENPLSPITKTKTTVFEFQATMEQYYKYEIGTEGMISLYRHSDGLVYPHDEN